MRTYEHTSKRAINRMFKTKSNPVPVFVPVFVKGSGEITFVYRPKPQHLQYSKAVATLCDASEEYGSFVGGVFAKEKYDKAISAVRNLQAQYMAL